MSRIVDQLPLEQVTSLDINLRQRFAFERADRELRLAARRKPHPGQARNGLFLEHAEADAQALGAVVGGLEVVVNAGFSVKVLPGAMLCAHTPTTLARPGTWSGNQDPDDDPVAGLYVLTAATNVQPASLPASLVTPEWWAVVVTPALIAKESDSARAVFNGGSGAFDPASQQKVFHRVLVPSVVRGAGGGDISTVTIPAGGVVVAWIYAHALGHTNLNRALFFDARRMPDPTAQNRVGGRWAARAQQVTGEWRATLLGEELSLRAASPAPGATTLPFAQIAEPGAAWPASGVAYLYLARVRGTVPRLRGTGLDVDQLHEFSSFEVAGALVLSPTPPATFPADGTVGQERFDLRNESTLALPNPTHNPAVPPYVLPLKFGGTAPAGEAICVGMLPYGALTGGVPDLGAGALANEVACGEDGWAVGPAAETYAVFFVALTSSAANAGTGLPEAQWTVATGSTDKKLPLDGLRVELAVSTADAVTALADVRQVFHDATNLAPPDGARVPMANVSTSAPNATHRARAVASLRTLPSARVVRAKWSVAKVDPGALTYGIALNFRGYRLPYGVDLYTPR